MNSWPLDEGLIDYVAGVLRHRLSRERALRRQRHRQHLADHRRQEARHVEDHQGAACRQAAGGWRRRGQCRHRLSRRRVPALGPGPERHRPRQRQSPGERLRHQEVHRRPLRPPRAISPRRHRPAGRRPCLDGGAMGARAARRARPSRTAPTEAGLTAILTGLGSLSYGELAGERMKLGLMIHDPEEEHDCFSDNTFASHYFDALGIRNVYVGRYRRVDGSVVQGPSVSDLIKAKSPEVDTEVRAKLDAHHGRHGRALSPRRHGRVLRPDDRRGERRRATPWCRKSSTACSTRRRRSSAPSPLSI